MKQIQIFIDTLSATCRLPVYEITKIDCESLATCNQTRYNEEKRGGVRQFGAKYITGGNPVW